MAVPRLLISMAIYFYVYPSAFQNPGGGEVQLLKTKEYLEKLGFEIRLYDPWKDKLQKGDLLHVFGSVKYCYGLMRTAREAGVKVLLSTICWSDWRSAFLTYPDVRQRTLNVLRHAAKVFCPWVPSMRKAMMEISDVLLPNSREEAKQLIRYFGVKPEKITVIPNGVDSYYEQADPDFFEAEHHLRDFFLCVGRIEPRKNQLALIRAHRGMKKPLVIVGEAVSRYKDYEARCRKEAAENVHFLGYLANDSDLLLSAYAACDTFVLPSWFETPGLAALEAGLAGAKLVTTNGGCTREYFGDDALYIEPGYLPDIRKKMEQASRQEKSHRLRDHIRRHYLWERVAERVADCYRRIL